MYSTTEKLILAYAVDICGINEESKIKLFVKSRSFHTDLTNWKVVYNQIVNDAKTNGYSNIIEYCEDIRYLKLIETLKEKIKIRNLLIEGKMDPKEYLKTLESKITTVLEDQEITEDGIKELHDKYVKPKIKTQYENIIKKGEYIEKQLEIKEVIKSTQPLIIPPSSKEKLKDVENAVVKDEIDIKSNKRYYLKMNEQEREFDDYLDKVEDFYYYNDEYISNESANDLMELFPVFGKIKNKEERRELMKKEIIRERKNIIEKLIIQETQIKKPKKAPANEIQYNKIVERVSGKKTGEKEKTAWIGELKFILKYLCSRINVKKNIDCQSAHSSLQIIISELSKDSNLNNIMLKTLMILQDLFFKLESEPLLLIVGDFKRNLCSFFDYYRK